MLESLDASYRLSRAVLTARGQCKSTSTIPLGRDPAAARQPPDEVGKLRRLLKIFRQNTRLLSGAENVCLTYHFRRVFLESITVAVRTSGDSACHDGVATFTHLIKLRFLSNFCCFGGSLSQGHNSITCLIYRGLATARRASFGAWLESSLSPQATVARRLRCERATVQEPRFDAANSSAEILIPERATQRR